MLPFRCHAPRQGEIALRMERSLGLRAKVGDRACTNSSGEAPRRPAQSFGCRPMNMNVEALLRQAEQETGLNDWGEDQSFLEGLEQLTAAARTAGLPEQGLANLAQQIVQLLVLRLRLVGDERAHPEIVAQEIERPLVLTGL